jgi:exosortase
MSAAAPTTAPPVTDRTQQVVAELQACWGQLPNKDLFLVLTGSWLVLLSFLGNSTFGYVVTRSLPLWMFNAYTAPQSEDGHGLLMPLVVAYLFYVRRHYILGGQLRLWWPGLLVLGAACGLHGLGFLVQQPRLSILALLGGLYGIMGTCWGPGFLRRSFFPFWMLLFLVPLGSLADPLSVPLRVLVCEIVRVVCNLAGMDVMRVGTALFSPDRYQYEVAAACSGLRSLIATFALATIYGFTFFSKPWKQWLLVASAVPLAVLGNCFRMMAIVLAAEWFGQQTGAQVHESTFWSLLPYVPAIMGLIFLGRWIGEDDPTPPQAEPSPQP